MRTQTELVIQRQNRDLLQSMDEQAKHQLRLQQAVERLSIAAVTYYGVGLVGYIAATMPIEKWSVFNHIKALTVPLSRAFSLGCYSSGKKNGEVISGG